MTNRIHIAHVRSGFRASLLLAAAVISVPYATQSAWAQMGGEDTVSSADADRRLGTITVEARKRSESLQDVPVTVSAVSSEEIENYQLDTVTDLATRVPTMQIVVGGSGSGGALSLRGVGTPNISAAFDSAVLLNVDGLPISTMRVVQNSFMDLEQVEVLKGPQSLFFGKSASAGVLSFRSKGPGDTFESEVSAAYEFEEKSRIVSGFVSGPLTDTLGARLAVRYMDTDEVIKNSAPGVANPERGESSLDARLTIDWDVTPDLNANLKIATSHYENDGSSLFSDIACPANATGRTVVRQLFPNATPDPTSSSGFSAPSGLDCNPYDKVIQFGDPVPMFSANNSGISNPIPFTDSDLMIARLALDYNLSDKLTLSSVTGYLDLNSDDFDGFSYDANAIGTGYSRNSQKGISQELRLESDFDGAFNFMFGAYYEDRESIFDTDQVTVGAAAMAIPVLGFFGGPDPVTGFTNDWRKVHTTDSKAFSIFASGDLDLSDRLTVSAGLRYTEEEKTNQIVIPYMHGLLAAIGFVQAGTVIGPIDFDDTNLSPEVSAVYTLNDNMNLFAAYKTGFKSGGIDNSSLPSAGLGVAAATGDYTDLLYDSETAEGFEGGLKSVLSNGSLRWNLTAYRYVFSDLQTQNFNPVAVAFVTSNAGEVTTQGIETDFVWATDIDGLTLQGALAYTDAKFTDTYIQVDDLDGRRTTAPEWAGNFGADYVRTVGSNLEWRLSGFATMSGDYFLAATELDNPKQKSWATVDLSTSIGAADNRWKISLVGNNIFDEIYATRSGGRPFSLPNAAGEVDQVRTLNRGRQIFLEARFRF